MNGSVREAIRVLGLDGVRPAGLREVLRTAGLPSIRDLIAAGRGALNLPESLEFRLRFFIEKQSTDNFIQGASDEVFIQGVGTDSGLITMGADGLPNTPRLIRTPFVGDASDNAVRNQWRVEPHVLLSFDLRPPASWPRTFTSTLLVVEEDNESLLESFSIFEEAIRETIDQEITTVAVAAGVLAGAVVGSLIPGIGTVVASAVGSLGGAAVAEIIQQIKEGLGNEAFTPVSAILEVSDPASIREHPDIGVEQTIQIQEFGADYEIFYDWNLVG